MLLYIFNLYNMRAPNNSVIHYKYTIHVINSEIYRKNGQCLSGREKVKNSKEKKCFS